MRIGTYRWTIAGMLIAGMLAGFGLTLWSEPPTATPATATAAHISTVRLALGQSAPDLSATDLQTAKDITLKDFRGKPLVLQFASLTEPVFRLHAPAAEKLAGDFAEKTAFVIIYQREAHAADTDAALTANQQEGFALAQPASLAERVKLATQCVDRLKLTRQRVLVDAWSDATSQRYGGLSNMTFLIDAEGNLAAGYPWMDTPRLKGALEAVLARKPVPAEFAGPIRSTTIPATDLAQGGGGGPLAGLVTVLDRMKLTEKQKQAIYPPLATYMAALRDFRETRQPAPDKAESVKPEDLQKKLEAIRADGDKVRAAFKESLGEEDAKVAIDALDRAFGARGPRAK